MKLSDFEKAQELREAMETINALEDLIANATVKEGHKNRCLIAAIDNTIPTSEGGSMTCAFSERYKLNNVTSLPEELGKKFIQLLKEEKARLDKEFSAL